MLQLKTIHSETYALLKGLSGKKELSSFALAGGTALALMLGHRISVDLDFFTEKEFVGSDLLDTLSACFDTENCSIAKNSLSLVINFNGSSVQIDFIRHTYSRLRPITVVDGIRLFSIQDIAETYVTTQCDRMNS